MNRQKKTLADIINDSTIGQKEKYKWYINNSDEWKQIRDIVLIRDNFTCQCCNRTQQEIDEYNTKKGKKLLSLVVHHKTYKNLFNEVETNYKDLITLCSPCHKQIHLAPNNRNRFKFNDLEQLS